MTVEKAIIGLILAIALFFTLRSLMRMWRGGAAGGCSSCPGCGDPEKTTGLPPPADRDDAQTSLKNKN